MLLIIFLGLIVKLTSIFGDCHIGYQEVKTLVLPLILLRSRMGTLSFLTSSKHKLRCGHLNFLRKFKYSQNRTRRDLESKSHSLFPHYIMFFGHINAPATLPIYLCTSWIANFSADCTVHCTRRLFYAIQRSLLNKVKWLQARKERIPLRASFTPQSFLFHYVYVCVTVWLYWIFLL